MPDTYIAKFDVGARATKQVGAINARRMLCGVALMVGIMASLVFGFGLTQSASAHDRTSNGCTTPVIIPYWNERFHAQCDTHDHCYNEKWYGSGWWGKAPCDNRFYSEMIGNCGWNLVCQGVAHSYYTAVRDWGWYAWYNSSWFH